MEEIQKSAPPKRTPEPVEYEDDFEEVYEEDDFEDAEDDSAPPDPEPAGFCGSHLCLFRHEDGAGVRLFRSKFAKHNSNISIFFECSGNQMAPNYIKIR